VWPCHAHCYTWWLQKYWFCVLFACACVQFTVSDDVANHTHTFNLSCPASDNVARHTNTGNKLLRWCCCGACRKPHTSFGMACSCKAMCTVCLSTPAPLIHTPPIPIQASHQCTSKPGPPGFLSCFFKLFFNRRWHRSRELGCRGHTRCRPGSEPT